MPAAKFSLAVRSFTPPTLPEVPEDLPASAITSSISGSPVAATSPLRFVLSLPSARSKNPLFPATRLQIAYFFKRTGEIFLPEPVQPGDVLACGTDADPNLYEVVVEPKDVLRVKVNEGETSAGEVRVYAWREDKMLGQWIVGTIEKLGLEGYKSFDLHQKRMEAWKKAGIVNEE